jgi:hypothetical protein
MGLIELNERAEISDQERLGHVSVDVVPNLVCLRWQQELNISVRTLHRVLACGGETFGQLLLQAKLAVGSRCLSPRCSS